MSFLTVLAHTETDYNNFLSRLLSHLDIGWLFVFVGIVIVVSIVVVAINNNVSDDLDDNPLISQEKVIADEFSDEQFKQELKKDS